MWICAGLVVDSLWTIGGLVDSSGLDCVDVVQVGVTLTGS